MQLTHLKNKFSTSYSCFSHKFTALNKNESMQLFYVPGISGSEIILDETESKHAVKVLRLGKGDSIICTDGAGGLYTATITDAHPKHCKLSIVESKMQVGKRNYNIHIAIAPTKNNERLEWFLEKATEIGIDEISLLLCDNSERRKANTERLEKVVVSAMKQSVKAYLPKLNEPVPFDEFIADSKAGQKFIAHCRENNLPHLKDMVQKEKSVLVLIGPEGDFSNKEIELAIQHGFEAISLGNSRLRTETAGIVSCHIVNLANV
jgi:16S rRNA (uracil1498-N3)-methyltransferase